MKRIVAIYCGQCVGRAGREPIGWIVDGKELLVEEAPRRVAERHVHFGYGATDADRARAWEAAEWRTVERAEIYPLPSDPLTVTCPLSGPVHGGLVEVAEVLTAVNAYRSDGKVRGVRATTL